ncbi:MAG: hypothetical protein RSA20_01255, partial [Oscillospiraceae bacterium]
VPAFFFASGLFATGERQHTPLQFVISRAKSILIPYCGFAVINCLVYLLYNRQNLSDFWQILLSFVQGRRNQIYAAAMWFLPCIFIVACLYELAMKKIKNPKLLLLVSICISIAAKLFWEEPVTVFSFNVALRYLAYYALGDYIRQVSNTQKKKVQYGIALGVVPSVICVGLLMMKGGTAVTLLGTGTLQVTIMNVICTLSGIEIIYLCALLLCKIPLVCQMGQYTVVYCGMETVARALIPSLLSLVGIGFSPAKMSTVILYNGLLFLFIYFIFVIPIQKFCPILAGKQRGFKERKICI